MSTSEIFKSLPQREVATSQYIEKLQKSNIFKPRTQDLVDQQSHVSRNTRINYPKDRLSSLKQLKDKSKQKSEDLRSLERGQRSMLRIPPSVQSSQIFDSRMSSKNTSQNYETSVNKIQLTSRLTANKALQDVKITQSDQLDKFRAAQVTQLKNFRPKIQQDLQNHKQEDLKSRQNSTVSTCSQQISEGKNDNQNVLIVEEPTYYQINDSPQKVQKLDNGYISKFDLPRYSQCSQGIVKHHIANTDKGLIKIENTDRLSIICSSEGQTPKFSYFGIYDGHGGPGCADRLRNKLHVHIMNNEFFPRMPVAALNRGYEKMEKEVLEYSTNRKDYIEKSGSCALSVLIMDDICYVANLGSSRAILSSRNGQELKQITSEHNLKNSSELLRIKELGEKQQLKQGPKLPKQKSTTRSFGDVTAKLEKYGGHENIITSTPEICQFQITASTDFLFIGTDGIFEVLSNNQVSDIIWQVYKEQRLQVITSSLKSNRVHEISKQAIEGLMAEAMKQQGQDNISAILIAFENLEKQLHQSGTLMQAQ